MRYFKMILIAFILSAYPGRAFTENLSLEYECEEEHKQRIIDCMKWYFSPLWVYLKEANPEWDDDKISSEVLRQWLLEKEARYRTIKNRNEISHDTDDWLLQ